MIKQVIIVRDDLIMKIGEMCAQVAHASMKVFFDRMQRNKKIDLPYINYQINATKEMQIWIDNKFTKIVVGCENLNALNQIHEHLHDIEITNNIYIPHVIIKNPKNKETKPCKYCDYSTGFIMNKDYSFIDYKICHECKGKGYIILKEAITVCMAIGPHESDIIDQLTGDLKLL